MTLLYSLPRRLFNERAGLCAAALFAVTEAAVFLGNFATYDATCLFLLALAAWITVRTAASRWPVFLLAALPAALAVGVPAVLDETGLEVRLAGLENSPHAASTSASRTSGTTLNDFLTQAFMTIPPRLRASYPTLLL